MPIKLLLLLFFMHYMSMSMRNTFLTVSGYIMILETGSHTSFHLIIIHVCSYVSLINLL